MLRNWKYSVCEFKLLRLLNISFVFARQYITEYTAMFRNTAKQLLLKHARMLYKHTSAMLN